MQPSDWPAVRAIYEQGLATRQATFETEAPSWEEWDAGHLAELRLVAGTHQLLFSRWREILADVSL